MNLLPAEYVSYIFSIKREPILLPSNVGYSLTDRIGFLVEQMTSRGFSAGNPIFYGDNAFVNVKKEHGKPGIVLEDLAKNLGLECVYNGIVSMRPASHFV